MLHIRVWVQHKARYVDSRNDYLATEWFNCKKSSITSFNCKKSLIYQINIERISHLCNIPKFWLVGKSMANISGRTTKSNPVAFTSCAYTHLSRPYLFHILNKFIWDVLWTGLLELDQNFNTIVMAVTWITITATFVSNHEYDLFENIWAVVFHNIFILNYCPITVLWITVDMTSVTSHAYSLFKNVLMPAYYYHKISYICQLRSKCIYFLRDYTFGSK